MGYAQRNAQGVFYDSSVGGSFDGHIRDTALHSSVSIENSFIGQLLLLVDNNQAFNQDILCQFQGSFDGTVWYNLGGAFLVKQGVSKWNTLTDQWPKFRLQVTAQGNPSAGFVLARWAYQEMVRGAIGTLDASFSGVTGANGPTVHHIVDANPTIGSEWHINGGNLIPAGQIWVIRALHMTFNASATIGPRQLSIVINTVPRSLYRCTYQFPVNANETVILSCAVVGSPNPGPDEKAQMVPIPELKLFGGWDFATTTVNMDTNGSTGDTYTTPSYYVDVYPASAFPAFVEGL